MFPWQLAFGVSASKGLSGSSPAGSANPEQVRGGDAAESRLVPASSSGAAIRLRRPIASFGSWMNWDSRQHSKPCSLRVRLARSGYSLTEDNLQEWRDQRDWIERKYAMWERGEKLPSQIPCSRMRCPCGVELDSHVLADSLTHVPHITAAQKRDGIAR